MNHGTCIHFNGVQNKQCKKGIAYDSVRAPALPCIKFIERSERGGTHFKPGEKAVSRTPFVREGISVGSCLSYEEPTDEAIEADRIESEKHLEKTIAALKVASKWRVRPKPKVDRRETVECPVCKGKLHLSQSSYNGHVHGTCSTDGCVRWME